MAESESQYLSFCVSMMRRAALWNETPKELLRCIAYSLNLLLAMLMSAAAIDTTDVLKFTAVGVTLVSMVSVFCKMIMMAANRTKVHWVARDTWIRCAFLETHFPQHKAFLRKREQHMLVITKGFILLSSIVMGVWSSKAVLHIIGVVSDGDLPFKMRFPFDTSNRFYFGLAFIYDILYLYTLIPTYVLVHTFFVGLIILTCAQLKILCMVLKSLDADTVHSELNHCIDIHNSITRFAKELEALMSPLLLIQFSLNMSLLCQTFIQLASVPLLSEHTVMFVGFFTLQLLEVWLYCYFGNNLIEASLEVQHAAYSSQWLTWDSKLKKSMALIILRSQKPLKLNTGKMYIVSLDTFTQVIKFSYSLFTLLRQVNSQQL